MWRQRYSAVIAMFAAWFMAAPAMAVDAHDTHREDTLVVTAQKQEEKIIEVPASVSVLTGEAIDDADIRDTRELLRYIPNLHARDSGSEHVIIIRGVSSYSGSLVSPAGYYVDDIPYPLQVMHNTDFLDVERVEVLRGPQGTLYGKNSESGLVHVITRAPDNEVRGRVRVGAANYERFDAGALISGPIVKDRLFASFQVQGLQSDGYVENIMTGNDEAASQEHLSGRTRIRWTPTPDWEIEYLADALHHDDGYGIFRFYEGAFTSPFHTINQDIDNQSKEEDATTHSLRLNHVGDLFDMTLVTGYQDYSMDAFGDRWLFPMNNGTNLFSYGSRQTTSELRISSPKGAERWKWLVGVSTGFEETEYGADVHDENATLVSFRRSDLGIDSQAVFGQFTWNVMGNWFFTAGGRFDHQSVDGDIDETKEGTPMDFEGDVSFTEFLPKVALRYSPLEDLSIYTSASKGFMAGGINVWGGLDVPESIEYDPEYTWNYEIGMKGRFFDRRLDLDLALFYIDITDKQVSEMDVQYEQSIIRNVASATSMGAELSFAAHLTPGLDLLGGVGVIESEIDDWTAEENVGTPSVPNVITVDYSGNKLQNVPEYTASLGLLYRASSGFFGRVDVLGQGKFYGDPKNESRQDAYALVNAKIGYETDFWDVALWGKNLNDEEYSTYVAPFGNYGMMARDGAPLTFGVTANWRF